MADSSILGPQRFEVIVDREKFEKELVSSHQHCSHKLVGVPSSINIMLICVLYPQHEALNKALNATEAPPKEKHVRS